MGRLMGLKVGRDELGARLDELRCEIFKVIDEIGELGVQRDAHTCDCQTCLPNTPSCSDGLWFYWRIKQKDIVHKTLESERADLESKISIYGIPQGPKGPKRGRKNGSGSLKRMR